MNGENYVENTDFRPALDAASGTTDRFGEEVDANKANNVAFVVSIYSIAGGTAAVYVQDADAKAGPYTRIPTSLQLITSAGTRMVEIRNPRKPWLRLEVDKDGTNATSESAVALLGNTRREPLRNPRDGDANTDYRWLDSPASS